MPRAALGKAFAEGFWAFAECPGPSAKRASPVVVRAQDISIDLTEKVRRCQGGKRLWKKMFQTVEKPRGNMERIALEPGFSCN